MTQPHSIDGALLGEVFDALDAVENFLKRPDPSHKDMLIESVMGLRRKSIAAGPDTGIYTAAHLRAVLEASVNGIIFIDTHGVVEVFNPAAQRMFGYAAQEVIGKNVSMLVPPPYSHEHDQYLARYLQTGQAKVIGTGGVLTAKRKDGSVFQIHLSVSEARAAGRRTFTAFLQDLSGTQKVRPLPPPPVPHCPTRTATLSQAFSMSYGKAGDETRTHDIHVGNVTLYH